MRKCEEKMVATIRGLLRGGSKWMDSDNTRVEALSDHLIEIRLHGSLIGEVIHDNGLIRSLKVTLAGYNTNTTRNRVTAILREFGAGVCWVGTKQGQVIYSLNGNHYPKDSDEWVTVRAV